MITAFIIFVMQLLLCPFNLFLLSCLLQMLTISFQCSVLKLYCDTECNENVTIYIKSLKKKFPPYFCCVFPTDVHDKVPDEVWDLSLLWKIRCRRLISLIDYIFIVGTLVSLFYLFRKKDFEMHHWLIITLEVTLKINLDFIQYCTFLIYTLKRSLQHVYSDSILFHSTIKHIFCCFYDIFLCSSHSSVPVSCCSLAVFLPICPFTIPILPCWICLRVQTGLRCRLQTCYC